MIKIVLAIVIVVLLGYIGYGIEKYYKTRLKILLDYKNFIAFVRRETDFFKSNVEELIEKYDYSTEYLKALLTRVINNENYDRKFLSKEESIKIQSFVTELSKADYYFKNVVIKNAEELVNQMINLAEKEKIQKGELGRKLIILLGIGLIILII
ncbi:MAG: hypothetical protein IKB56_07270 [Clostridia bacterium]|nr:hypothetical protein [Clostridia bacterium]